MSHIFVSYSRKDIEFARHLHRLLEDCEFDVWMDEEDILPGDPWWEDIKGKIESCTAFIVICSPDSKESEWVEREISHAREVGKKIIPVLLAGERWSSLQHIHEVNMTAGLDAPLPPRLVAALRRAVISRNDVLSAASPAPAPPPSYPEIPQKVTRPATGKSWLDNWRRTVALIAVAGLCLVGGGFILTSGMLDGPDNSTPATAVPTNSPIPNGTLTPSPLPPTPTETPNAATATWSALETRQAILATTQAATSSTPGAAPTTQPTLASTFTAPPNPATATWSALETRQATLAFKTATPRP